MQAGGALWRPTHNEVVITLIETPEKVVAATSAMMLVTGVGVGGDAEADGIVTPNLLQNEQRREL